MKNLNCLEFQSNYPVWLRGLKVITLTSRSYRSNQNGCIWGCFSLEATSHPTSNGKLTGLNAFSFFASFDHEFLLHERTLSKRESITELSLSPYLRALGKKFYIHYKVRIDSCGEFQLLDVHFSISRNERE